MIASIKRVLKFFIKPIYSRLNRIEEYQKESFTSQQNLMQKQLMASYQLGVKAGLTVKPLHEIGFSTFSENTEDGVLLYIFSIIGSTNKKCVEIGCGYGRECNTANLLIHHNWTGLLIDAGEKQTAHAKNFFNSFIKREAYRPVVVRAHITKSNVNKIIKKNGFAGEVDLLSIDIDGVDYWIWKEIEVCNPRVIVAEIQCIWYSETAVTVPYDDHFEPGFMDGYGIYSGASLAAFDKLAKQKGYRFIGVERSGYNAFFLRNDIQSEYLPEEDLAVIDNLSFVKWAREKFYDQVKERVWVEV